MKSLSLLPGCSIGFFLGHLVCSQEGMGNVHHSNLTVGRQLSACWRQGLYSPASRESSRALVTLLLVSRALYCFSSDLTAAFCNAMELSSGGHPLSAETWEYIPTLARRMGEWRHQEVEVCGCIQDLKVGHPGRGGGTEAGGQQGEGMWDAPATLCAQNLLLAGMHMWSFPPCLLAVPSVTVKTLQ